MATEEDVAHVIVEAATDRTDQLRYVATEDIKPLLAARRETSEAEYIKFMKEQLDSAVAERQIRSTDCKKGYEMPAETMPGQESKLRSDAPQYVLQTC